MITDYIPDPSEAMQKAKDWLRGNTRTHALIGRTHKGYVLIDPRNKGKHYCQIVAKLYRKER